MSNNYLVYRYVPITYMGCRYCDGASSHMPYGEDESVHCTTCGAEWDPVEINDSVEVPVCCDCGSTSGVTNSGLCYPCHVEMEERNKEEEFYARFDEGHTMD